MRNENERVTASADKEKSSFRIFTLLVAGKSQREIARITQIDRKAIHRLARRFADEQAEAPGETTGSTDQKPPPRPPSPTSECEPYRAFIEAQLRLRRNFTAIYQDLVDQFGFSASYNSVKRFAATMVEQDPKQYDRQEFLPGEEVQVDYGEGALTLVAGTDRYRRPRLFVMTMRYSRRSFRRVVGKSSKKVWAQLLEQAWRYFGGCAQYCVLDNLKEGVIKPDLYEPELNSVYAAVLAHYGVVADPARVRDPDRRAPWRTQFNIHRAPRSKAGALPRSKSRTNSLSPGKPSGQRTQSRQHTPSG